MAENLLVDTVTFFYYYNRMNDMKNLSDYLAERNAKTLEWVNAGEGRWATTLVEDLDHWAEYGIHTPLQLDWYLAACDRHEAVREGDGYKPYWPQMPSTDAELKDDILFFEQEAENAYARAKAHWEREEAEAEYQRQLAGEHTPAVVEALKPSASFTIGELCSL